VISVSPRKDDRLKEEEEAKGDAWADNPWGLVGGEKEEENEGVKKEGNMPVPGERLLLLIRDAPPSLPRVTLPAPFNHFPSFSSTVSVAKEATIACLPPASAAAAGAAVDSTTSAVDVILPLSLAIATLSTSLTSCFSLTTWECISRRIQAGTCTP